MVIVEIITDIRCNTVLVVTITWWLWRYCFLCVRASVLLWNARNHVRALTIQVVGIGRFRYRVHLISDKRWSIWVDKLPYLGNQHIVGDSVNNLVLEDIQLIPQPLMVQHQVLYQLLMKLLESKASFVQGQRVTYNNGGSNIGGLQRYSLCNSWHRILLNCNIPSNAASLQRLI